jgi:hypothetical protein
MFSAASKKKRRRMQQKVWFSKPTTEMNRFDSCLEIENEKLMMTVK